MTAIGAIEETARDIVDGLETWVSGVSVASWVFAALAIAALAWILTGLRAMTRLGPIEIEPLEQEELAGLPVKSLTATVARRLSESGLLSPPQVPAGAPQADVITAVENSPIPQANWIAALMRLVPRPQPAAYTLGGTVVAPKPAGAVEPAAGAVAPADDEDGAPNAGAGAQLPAAEAAAVIATGEAPHGISFRLRPVREGHELQKFVAAAGEDLHLVAHRVADLAYLHIIEDAADLLPLWARWHSPDAFAAYMDCMEKLDEGEDIEAARNLNDAAAESTNLLVRLQYANLLERLQDPDLPDEIGRALCRARALNEYLRVARLEPSLVEPRYRASVLSAMLASDFAALPAEAQVKVCDAMTIATLPLGADGAASLADLSVKQTKHVLQLLRPWYTLLRQRRLRHQLELTGFERRRLRRTVIISKHCVGLRKAGTDTGRWTRFVVRCRRAAVRWHMAGGSVGWQAHYNAACFYALLCRRAGLIRDEGAGAG